MKPSPSIVALTGADLRSVDALRSLNTETLGFLADKILSHYLVSGGGLGLKTQDDRLVAYLLFARHKYHIRIIHLCVASEARGIGCARELVNQLVHIAKSHGIGVIKLNCRRDYPAHSMWPNLGFVPLGEKPAKASGQRLTQWCFAIEGQGERDLFHIAVSDQKINAVIDAQIFFHLHEPSDNHAVISKGLQDDFLDDSLQLYITDEMFVEINRSHSETQREISRNNAHSFWKVCYDAGKMNEFSSDLEQILPAKTESQRSDIKQLAKTAASEVSIFLTLDQKLLRAANKIEKAVGVRVLSPIQIIVQLAELMDPDSYISTPLSGSDLVWRKFDHDDFAYLRMDHFLAPYEKKYNFQKPLEESLSQPRLWQTDGIWLRDELVAVRATRAVSESSLIAVNLCRAARGSEYKLFIRFVIASILYDAVRDSNVEKVLIFPHSISSDTVNDLHDLGFIRTPDGFVRLCPSKVMLYDSLQKMLYDMKCKEYDFQKLEKMCSPVILKDSLQNCFMIPIKPGYARSLFNINLAKDDMFGAERSVLLRWSNVYYRRKSHHHMLKAPARILWYESGSNARVVAISHLDAVTNGSPKEMFHQHRHMGVLSWSDIYNMCKGTTVQDIMVLRFSHTYLFNRPVVLDDLRVLYRKHGFNFIPRSPSRVPKALFLDIFQMGYERR